MFIITNSNHFLYGEWTKFFKRYEEIKNHISCDLEYVNYREEHISDYYGRY
jgi:hypothetical protein